MAGHTRAKSTGSPVSPAQREQILLNGVWKQGGQVPLYSGAKIDTQTYQRQVTVPLSWTGRVIRLEFEKVNHIAEIYIDGQPAGRHVGGWIPFTLDITHLVSPGRSFTLRVEVQGSSHQPIVDAQGLPLFPIGAFELDGSNSGIVDDVWLRAYGEVHFEDAFIQTSYRRKELTIDYALRNDSATPRTVKIEAQVVRAASGDVEKTITAPELTLVPGEEKNVRVRKKWQNPDLWMPDEPNLYLLQSRLVEGTECIDQETRRFGFRETWICANQYILNGIRVNLWGDSIPMAWFQYGYSDLVTPETWRSTVDMLMHDLNIRIVRFHQSPAPVFTLDAADEKGLLIINESAMYGRPWYTHCDKDALLDNVRNKWTPAWIRANRNHPSIILWSACNEQSWYWTDDKTEPCFTGAQLRSLGDAIRQHDTTRSVIYDGDSSSWLGGGEIFDVTVNYHYPEGYEEAPKGSIYSWADKLHVDKPTGIGEFITSYAKYRDDNIWWQGTWVRGLRYLNFTDIRPFKLEWAWKDMEPAAKANLKNSFAPVALFDKEYDDLGIAPLKDGKYPHLAAGETVTRKFVLYNDEFRGSTVTVQVALRSGDTVFSTGSRTYELALGEHIEIPCSFQVPDTGGKLLELVLETRKNDLVRFSETKKFNVTGSAGGKKSSKAIVLGLEDLPRSKVLHGPGSPWAAKLATPLKLNHLVITPSYRKGEFDSHAVDGPFPFRHGDRYYMTYIGWDGIGYRTGLASSEDLIHWNKEGLILDRGPAGSPTEFNVAMTCILRNNDLYGSGELKRVNGRYVGTYHAYPALGYEEGSAVIGICYTKDLHTWELDPPVLRPENGAAWERGGLYKSYLLEHEGTYYLFYNAKNQLHAPWVEQTGMAISNDLVHWEHYENNPVIPIGQPGAFDDIFASDPVVLRGPDGWLLFYYALCSDGHARDSVALSNDLLHWTKSQRILIDVGAPGSIDSQYAHKPGIFGRDGRLYHYYCAVSPYPRKKLGEIEHNEVRGIAVAYSG